MDTVIFKYWKKRVQECKRCEYSKPWIGKIITCGTFAVGDTVTVGENEYKLCGCIMQLKAKIERSTCPLNRWKDVNHTDK